MKDDFFTDKDRLFKRKLRKKRDDSFKPNCKTGHHDYRKDGSYDKVYDWLKCKICGTKCLGFKDK